MSRNVSPVPYKYNLMQLALKRNAGEQIVEQSGTSEQLLFTIRPNIHVVMQSYNFRMSPSIGLERNINVRSHSLAHLIYANVITDDLIYQG